MNSFSVNRLKHIGLWSAALVLGLACGRMMPSAMDLTSVDESEGDSPIGFKSSESRSQNSARMNSSNRYLWLETAESRNPKTYESEVDRLYRESRSPLRASSLQSHSIQNSTFEEWEQLLAEGKIDRLESLTEVGAYLANLDPERALRLMFHGPTDFDTLDHLYTFRDSVVSTITTTNPQMVLDTLQRMKRGGAQMDSGRFFSETWAKKDPQAAANHFDELMPLRNMSLEGATPKIPYDEFAQIIMKSWVSKDPAKAQSFLESLPTSLKRDALQNAYNRLSPKTDGN
jgi:hypothetical protein